MTPYEECMQAIIEFKKRENKLLLQKKRIELELKEIELQKMELAIIISGGNSKYIQEVINNELTRTHKNG